MQMTRVHDDGVYIVEEEEEECVPAESLEQTESVYLE